MDHRLRHGQRTARTAQGNQLAATPAWHWLALGAGLLRTAECGSAARSTGCGPHFRTPPVQSGPDPGPQLHDLPQEPAETDSAPVPQPLFPGSISTE